MGTLTIVANIHAKADRTELVKSALLKLIPTTRAEPGCIQYDLHQNNEDSTHFMFFENWESRELWQAQYERATFNGVYGDYGRSRREVYIA